MQLKYDANKYKICITSNILIFDYQYNSVYLSEHVIENGISHRKMTLEIMIRYKLR